MAKVDMGRATRILRMLEEANPRYVDLEAALKDELPSAKTEVYYLRDHNLLTVEIYETFDGDILGGAKITSAGLDFLSEDGGLTAQLGVVTIKLQQDQLQQLIEVHVLRSDLPQTQKQRLIEQLRELPAETTKHLAMKLVDAGLSNWQIALPLLQKLMAGL
ncbi:hypothetical protein ACO0J1_13665 [Stenotrophomonas acidaminiphila]|uniref:hypothetical protein n=1 Tax=Stenotrophomonas acidaminiphila TaxID=128780 RepID=UPI0028AF952A|nr:hypothetical protein [Stenotrophomonas acidaminiphila]